MSNNSDKNLFKDDAGKWIEDEEQTTRLKCDFIISAFGSGLYDPQARIYKISVINISNNLISLKPEPINIYINIMV